MKYLTALTATALLGWAGALTAQPPQQGAQTPPTQAPSMNQGQQQVTEQQLEQFSDAMDEVSSVQQEYSQQIREAQDMEQAQTLQTDAQEEMRSAVEDNGLSIQQYNQISQQLQNDPALIQRLQEIRSQ